MRVLLILGLIALLLWGASVQPAAPLTCQSDNGIGLSWQAVLLLGAVGLLGLGAAKRTSQGGSLVIISLAVLIVMGAQALHIFDPVICGG